MLRTPAPGNMHPPPGNVASEGSLRPHTPWDLGPKDSKVRNGLFQVANREETSPNLMPGLWEASDFGFIAPTPSSPTVFPQNETSRHWKNGLWRKPAVWIPFTEVGDITFVLAEPGPEKLEGCPPRAVLRQPFVRRRGIAAS